MGRGYCGKISMREHILKNGKLPSVADVQPHGVFGYPDRKC